MLVLTCVARAGGCPFNGGTIDSQCVEQTPRTVSQVVWLPWLLFNRWCGCHGYCFVFSFIVIMTIMIVEFVVCVHITNNSNASHTNTYNSNASHTNTYNSNASHTNTCNSNASHTNTYNSNASHINTYTTYTNKYTIHVIPTLTSTLTHTSMPAQPTLTPTPTHTSMPTQPTHPCPQESWESCETALPQTGHCNDTCMCWH